MRSQVYGQGYIGEGSKEALKKHQETPVNAFCPCCNMYLKFGGCIEHHTFASGECKNKKNWTCFQPGYFCSSFPREHKDQHICKEIKCKCCGTFLPPPPPEARTFAGFLL